ncbi:carbon-nitrogen hydrolase family protein [bacterium]|nr:carbon-nitrogen hydrolase family protein [bacterium]
MKAAVIQINTTDNIDRNLQTCRGLLDKAVSAGVRLAVLPETFAFSHVNIPAETAAANASAAFEWCRKTARALNIWLAAGSILSPGPDGRFYNRAFFFSPQGEVQAKYDKIHLFDCRLPEALYLESKDIIPGEEIASAALIENREEWRLGWGVCYDLRFPEQFRTLSERGLDILILPAAFTAKTGALHWEVLLRARAIENQCYILAANQSGTIGSGLKCWGHSMIIDPMGNICSQLNSGEENLAAADLDYSSMLKIRSELPALQHRRSFKI